MRFCKIKLSAAFLNSAANRQTIGRSMRAVLLSGGIGLLCRSVMLCRGCQNGFCRCLILRRKPVLRRGYFLSAYQHRRRMLSGLHSRRHRGIRLMRHFAIGAFVLLYRARAAGFCSSQGRVGFADYFLIAKSSQWRRRIYAFAPVCGKCRGDANAVPF